MKTHLAKIIALLIAATAISLAQTQYTVEPGTKQNTITLEVTNNSGRPLNDLQLVVEKSPSWVKIVEKNLSVQRVGTDSTVLLTIGFDVAANSKGGVASPQAGEKESIAIVLSLGCSDLKERSGRIPNP